MSLFIEVNSVEKDCKVIVNLETVMEIAPIREGGCALFFQDAAAVGGKTAMKVTDSYSLFKQFVLETVSEEDIKSRIQTLSLLPKEDYPQTNLPPAPEAEEKRGRGRPPKSMTTSTSDLGQD
jgi:hypothetical protein